MGDSIDNVSIEISASAGDAVSKINQMITSLGRLNTATRTASGNTNKYSDDVEEVAQHSSEASKETKNLGSEMKNAGNSAKQGSSGIEKFISAIKRVMFYRVVRSVLRGIANAFKEGISNLYQWSNAVNGSFAKSMDRIATSTLYLKNSLAAMIAPIIERLAPVIEWIIDRIVDVINWLNKLFAALSGSQTYTVAKKVATKWGEVADKIDDTTSHTLDNVKETVAEMKKTILAFDEINKLEKQDSPSSSGSSGGGSGGGGGSTPGTDYTNMFETKKLDGWMSTLAAFIAKLKAGVPAVLGAILAGWLAIKAAVKAVYELAKKFWEKLKEIGAHIIEVPIKLIQWGWRTVKDWVLSLGPAVVSVAVTLATSAKELWTEFKREWQLAGAKVFVVSVAILETAKSLWNNFKAAWVQAGVKVLTVGVVIATSAKALWEGFKESWRKAGVKVFTVAVAITTSAKALWNEFKAAWAQAGTKVLAVGIAVTTSALSVWNEFKAAWAKAGVKVLAVGIAITTTAKAAWTAFKNAWVQAGAKVLAVGIAITTTAKQVWLNFKKSWAQAGVKVLTVGIGITTTAKSIWANLKKSWAEAPAKVLSVALMISTVAKTLFANFKTEWAKAPAKVLSVGVNLVKDGWTSVSDWFTKNESTIKKWALGIGIVALGVGVTIATGPMGLATAVSSLWAKAVALLGGALTIGVAPGFAAGDADFSNTTYGGHDHNVVRKGDVLGKRTGTSNTGNSSATNEMAEVVRTIQEYENTIKQAWTNIINTTTTSWSQVQGQVMQALSNIEKGMGTKMSAYAAVLCNGWKNITNVTVSNWTQIQGQVMQALANLETGISLKCTSFQQRVAAGWNAILNLTNKSWHDIQGQVVQALTNMEKGIDIKFSSMLKTAKKFDWTSIGTNIANGIARGLNNGWRYLNDLVWNLAISLYNTACYALGIASPSKLFTTGVGEMIDAGIVNGIENSKGDVLSSITRMANDMAAQLQDPKAMARMTAVGDYVGNTTGAAAAAYAGGEDNSYKLIEYINSGMHDATYQQNELLREQNRILQQLLEKPFTAEVSTNSIVNGLTRKNKRDGMTVVPVLG